MNKESFLINGEALGASKLGMLAVEQFLDDYYFFRRNVLNGKVEFATKKSDGQPDGYRPLTPESLNSIIINALRPSSTPSATISAVCPHGTDRTMWRVSSADCQA